MKKIGIIRGLYYYELGEIWTSMLEEFGFNVVVSPPSDKQTVEAGCRLCTDGACLPIKAYHGLIEKMRESGVDALFLPKVVKPYNKSFTCPKVIGVNDMVRAAFTPELKTVEPELKNGLFRFCLSSAVMLGAPPNKILPAYKKAKQKSAELTDKFVIPEKTETLTVALAGHPYLLYDESLNMGVTGILRELGCNTVIRSGFFSGASCEKAYMPPKNPFWISYEQNLEYINSLADSNISGIVYLSSFGCGPDSFASVFLKKCAETAGLAFCELVFDEHSGCEGLKTRLEAFTDLLNRKNEAVKKAKSIQKQ